MSSHDYAHDADGDALRRLVADGSDMSKPMEIDFAVAVPNESVGNAIADKARILGYAVRIVFDPGEDVEDDPSSWTCYCTRTIVPTYDAVIAAQSELDKVSKPLGGYCDGWGSFGNAARD